MDWKDEESQVNRLIELTSLINTEKPFTILDFGCGYGKLFEVLTKKFCNFTYYGTDICESSLEIASKYNENDHRPNFLKIHEVQKMKFDFTVSSGIFNVKFGTLPEWEKHIYSNLEFMNSISNIGFASNFLSSNVRPERQYLSLYYADASKIESFCLKNLSNKVFIKHNLDQYEFVVKVYK